MSNYKHDCDSCILLGSAIDKDCGTMSDIYFCLNKVSGNFNMLIRFGEQGENYSSGIDFVYRDTINNFLENKQKLTIREIALKLAIEKGYFSEKVFYVGFSEKKANENDEVYFNSLYYKNRPAYKLYDEEMNFEEFEKANKKVKGMQEEYDEQYKIEEKIIPPLPNKYDFIFNSIEEMNSYCEKEDCLELLAVNESHAMVLYESLKIREKHLQRKIKK